MGESREKKPARRGWFGGFSVPWRITFRLRPKGTGFAWRPRKRSGPDARSHRFLPDALPLLAPPSPNHSPDPEYDRRQRLRRSTALAGFALLLVIGIVTAMFGPRGVRDVRRAMRERDELKAVLDARQESVLSLRREVQRLQEEPRAMERIARESLGYAKPGEITFVLPGEAGAGTGFRRAKAGGAATPTVGLGPG